MALPFISIVHAAETSFKIDNPLGSNDFESILTGLASAIMDLAIPVAVAMYLYAGFLMLTAGGTSEKFSKGKTVFKYTTIGLVVIFIGGGFIDLIKSVLELGN